MIKNEYTVWNIITVVGSLICFIFSVFELLKGNWLIFLISIILILQVINMWKLTNFYNLKIKELKAEIRTKTSLEESEYIAKEQTQLLHLKLKSLISKFEEKSKQNFYQLKQAMIISQRQVKCLRRDLSTDIQGIQIELENLKNSLQNIQDGIYFEQLVKIIDHKYLTLEAKINEQKKYLYYIVSRSCQLAIRQMEELLIPVYEKQNYFEELQEIRKEQVKIAIQQLKIDLSHIQQQQNQDYSHLNKLILKPIKPLKPYLGNTQDEVVMDLQTKIDNLEMILDRVILEYQTTIHNLNLTTNNFYDDDDILSESKLSQTSRDNNLVLTTEELPLLSNNTIVSQFPDNQQLQMLNNIESVIQAEVENKSQEIEKMIENVSLQRENLDRLLEEKTRDYGQNFDVIYYNLNQINQLIMSLEGKYHSFTKVNQKVNHKFKSVITKLYQQEVKPLKTQIVTMADNDQYLMQKQTELEEVYYAISVDLKTEINKLKDEIFTELGKINDIIGSL